MISTVAKIYNEFKYASGLSQFTLFGIWTIIASGMFPLSGYLPVLTLLWLVSGLSVIAATMTLDRKLIRTALLSSVGVSVTTGSVFFSYALLGGDMRADMQSATMALVTLLSWGLYLANLCSRQIWDKEKVR
jgi:hypothetical protein